MITGDLTAWLLEHYGQEIMQPGLERIKAALSLLPKFKNVKIVTIAGTNGKGETTLWLSRLLQNENHTVWISPHIHRITERFRDQSGEINPEELRNLIEISHQQISKAKIKLSYYEFLFFVFCAWSVKKNQKFLLLEVGLGGRLDAVNALDADLVLLPSISRDHQEYLGNSYASILREKLALVRPGAVLLSYLSLMYLRERTFKLMKERGAMTFDLESLGLHPAYNFSARNQTLAYAAFSYLQNEDLSSVRSPKSYLSMTPVTEFLESRGEAINKNGEKIFFGSHNVDGVRKLIQFLHRGNYNFSRPPYGTVITAFSQRNERDVTVMLRMLKASGLGKIVMTHFPHPKALSMEVAKRLSESEGLEFVSDVETYLKSNQNNQSILVTGSYYFLGHFKSLLRSI